MNAPASRLCRVPMPPLGMELDSCRSRLLLWALLVGAVLGLAIIAAAIMLLWSGFAGTAGAVATIGLAVFAVSMSIVP